MAPKLFLTGSTGYIGGSVLNAIYTKHPSYDITVLLRNPPATFPFTYPNVKDIQGTYDDAEVLSAGAAEVDVVVHCGDSDHEPGIKALLFGLLSAATKEKPKYLIRLSGTAIVSDFGSLDYLGKKNPKVWSDIHDIDAITSLPDNAPHRNVDKMILQAGSENSDRLKVAIICPPDVFGRGSGPGRTTSIFPGLFVDETKKLGRSFVVGEGENTRSRVHINDLMKVYDGVVSAAAENPQKADWGTYYFASTEEVSQKDFTLEATKILKRRGIVESEEIESIGLDKVDTMVQYPLLPLLGRYLFASNSRTVPDRAKKLFGYAGEERGLLRGLEMELMG
ncbi:hypothetical protein V5O48_014172 [Marasmius crinis-equi]|uniref:NAD(P)-binding protein n=1 Tax=Marasmius crinis-equi TaxID=585013 RepID=A0ABR3EY27_9AGAR